MAREPGERWQPGTARRRAASGAAMLAVVLLAAPAEAGSAAERRWLLFSGASIAASSQYFYSGGRVSLAGDIERSGLIVAGASGAGLYRYADALAPGGRVGGQFTLHEAAAGYQFVAPGFGLALAAGLRREEHRLSAPDPGNPVQGARTGLLGQFDLWAKPRAGLLVTLAGSAAAVFGGYYLRAGAGWHVPFGNEVFAGIEAAVMGNRQYRETRFGLAVTGLELGPARLSAAAGLALARDTGAGGYGWLGAWGRF